MQMEFAVAVLDQCRCCPQACQFLLHLRDRFYR
jgi:hypothetical protein